MLVNKLPSIRVHITTKELLNHWNVLTQANLTVAFNNLCNCHTRITTCSTLVRTDTDNVFSEVNIPCSFPHTPSVLTKHIQQQLVSIESLPLSFHLQLPRQVHLHNAWSLLVIATLKTGTPAYRLSVGSDSTSKFHWLHHPNCLNRIIYLLAAQQQNLLSPSDSPHLHQSLAINSIVYNRTQMSTL